MILGDQEISILLCPYMQFIKSCTYWDSSTLQALHEHACLFYEKCNVDREGKMPSNITVFDAEIKIKYSHLNQGSLTQCYLVNKDSLVSIRATIWSLKYGGILTLNQL